MNFYNDNDSYVAQWLGNLIAAGHLPQGAVDERSIIEVEPAELGSFRQCHFFAGIGGWPYALKLAGWNHPCWTASCPCQPLSSAGQRKGHADKRHLWPALYRLIAECRPATIFGEQVASKDGREWLAGVRADLEDLGYAVGAADLCAAGAGAPHIRQRLFWVADAGGNGQSKISGIVKQPLTRRPDCGATGGMGDALRAHERGQRSRENIVVTGRQTLPQRQADTNHTNRSGAPWNQSEWLPCLDGKARHVEPGTFPLAHGVPNRVGRLRGYGNAIVPQIAAEFVRAFMELDDIG